MIHWKFPSKFKKKKKRQEKNFWIRELGREQALKPAFGGGRGPGSSAVGSSLWSGLSWGQSHLSAPTKPQGVMRVRKTSLKSGICNDISYRQFLSEVS